MENSRKEVREYRSAGGVVVVDEIDRVLALLRPDRLGPNGLPEIRLPKGHIEPGESREKTALREVSEEAGIEGLQLVADLGHQVVEFRWKDHDYRRDESCFLLQLTSASRISKPERQFRRLWLPWDQALEQMSYSAEREWIMRARVRWAQQAED
jgi:8-oxo-dGTP pyrophosphatase MutT (NUDIX family)